MNSVSKQIPDETDLSNFRSSSVRKAETALKYTEKYCLYNVSEPKSRKEKILVEITLKIQWKGAPNTPDTKNTFDCEK